MRIGYRLLVIIALLSSSNIWSATFDIYSYHSDPPFRLNNQTTDLSRAWVQQFNELHDDVKLNLVFISRPELNKRLEAKQPYLILWANPIWFASRDSQVKASEPIFWDSDIWISLEKNKVTYAQPRDLIGKTIGGREGYFYKGVNALVKEGKINRVNQRQDYDNYQALMAGRIQAFVMSRSSFLFWKGTQAVDTQPLYIAMSAHDAYTRHVLVSEDRRHLLPPLNAFIKAMKNNSDWQKKLKHWGIADLVNPFDIELNELEQMKVN